MITVTTPEGQVLWPARGYVAELTGRPSYAPVDDQLWVKITPSYRPGCEYDLMSYPIPWIKLT